jgi:hypothetical protein
MNIAFLPFYEMIFIAKRYKIKKAKSNIIIKITKKIPFFTKID